MDTPQVSTETFNSAIVIPKSYTAYRDETCEAASKVPLPVFPDSAALDVAIAAQREVQGIIDAVTKVEEMGRKPLNAALKKMRLDRDTFLANPNKEHARLAAGITAFSTAKLFHDRAEERRLADEQRAAEAARWKAAAEIARLEKELILKKGEVTTRDGLLIRNEEIIPLPEADRVAEAHGFICAERMVKALEVKQKQAADKLLAAKIQAEQAEIIADSVKHQLAAPTTSAKGLTVRVRWDFEIVNPYFFTEQKQWWKWDAEKELLKVDRAGLISALNNASAPHPWLPPETETSATLPKIGIRIFIDVKGHPRK